jgi:hypothetical protein
LRSGHDLPTNARCPTRVLCTSTAPSCIALLASRSTHSPLSSRLVATQLPAMSIPAELVIRPLAHIWQITPAKRRQPTPQPRALTACLNMATPSHELSPAQCRRTWAPARDTATIWAALLPTVASGTAMAAVLSTHATKARLLHTSCLPWDTIQKPRASAPTLSTRLVAKVPISVGTRTCHPWTRGMRPVMIATLDDRDDGTRSHINVGHLRLSSRHHTSSDFIKCRLYQVSELSTPFDHAISLLIPNTRPAGSPSSDLLVHHPTSLLLNIRYHSCVWLLGADVLHAVGHGDPHSSYFPA